jgi:predicted HicB family RNase H-like nuclease
MEVAISKAAQRAVNKYMKENYDRVNLTMPKGKKEELQAQATRLGVSVNAYINTAIDEKMVRDQEQETAK